MKEIEQLNMNLEDDHLLDKIRYKIKQYLDLSAIYPTKIIMNTFVYKEFVSLINANNKIFLIFPNKFKYCNIELEICVSNNVNYFDVVSEPKFDYYMKQRSWL